MRKAVYAGSFDPITNGHLWMVQEGAELFDELIVAVGINPDKKGTFSLEERLDMLKRTLVSYENVKVSYFENQFLVDYAKSIDAKYILRGIRDNADANYERRMRKVNEKLNPDIKTIFLMPNEGVAEISSSLVKGLIGPEGWEKVVKNYVPPPVYRKFLERFKGYFGRWKNLWGRLNAGEKAEEYYNKIINLYSSDKRYYHDFLHVVNCFEEFDNIKHLVKAPCSFELAIWLHDVVYDPRSKTNEERSAGFAEKIMREAKQHDYFIEKVKRLILATKHNKKPFSSDAEYLVDIDLAIFGKPEEEFWTYEKAIRKEYNWVSDEDYKKGRAEIIRKFLNRDKIFCTDYFRQKYEHQARINLGMCLGKLTES